MKSSVYEIQYPLLCLLSILVKSAHQRAKNNRRVSMQ